MEKTVKRFYWTAFFILLILTAYPIAMGARIVVLQFMHGSIQPEDYANYVIPYTAVGLSILIPVILYPLLSKLKRFSVPAASVLGSGLFLAVEFYIENVTLNSPEAQSTLQWQLASCIGTPAAMQAFQKLYDNTFKIHYFLISFTIILLVLGTVYSYGNVMFTKDRERKNMLRLQMVCIVLFIAFCIFANFTAFFRNAVDYLSPLSSLLTGAYFVILGLTFGSYLAGFLADRNKFVSVWLPAIAAFLVTSAMYYGEYKMLDGVLYRFGYSKFFQPLPYTVIAPADILVILASGALTAAIVGLIRWFNQYKGKHYKENI
jgi:hypothetical protein